MNQLIQDLMEIRQAILDGEKEYAGIIDRVHPNYRYSATNLIRYLKLRTFDLRKIQVQLSTIGLSSISHSERHVLANIENILHFLHLSQGTIFNGCFGLGSHPVNFMESQKVLKKNSKRLFNFSKNLRNTSIMVTLPSKAVSYNVVKNLLQAGMDVARINCGHDDLKIWTKMVQNVKRGVKECNRHCSIYFDLAGPKLRTAIMTKTKNKKKISEPFIHLHKNDTLHLHKYIDGNQEKPGDKPLVTRHSPYLTCTIPEIFDFVQPGERIWFDDGKIGGKIIQVKQDVLEIQITKTNPSGGKLKSEKGINLPETRLDLPSLTEEDLNYLPFIVEHADMIGYSFVRNSGDVRKLQNELKKLTREDVGIVLKIENKEAFNNLPALILQGMESPSLGVMTARGDLSVELGVERLSEVQEQILWFCEAALIPNIWATQVLETLVKKGIAARAEVTDAAMSARAECVMLNKGPYILEAVKTLQDIIDRMEQHLYKKQGTLRLLKVAEKFFKSKVDLP
jgi:pyruvate kinase